MVEFNFLFSENQIELIYMNYVNHFKMISQTCRLFEYAHSAK